MPTTPVNDVG